MCFLTGHLTAAFAAVHSLAGAGCPPRTPCEVATQATLVVPAHQACPTSGGQAIEALHACGDHPDLSRASLASSVALPARTICWYMLSSAGCPTPSERRDLLDQTNVCASPVSATSQDLVVCDAAGELVGHVLASGESPSACPATIAVGASATPRSLVGHDLYAARVVCAYDAVEVTECGGGGGLNLD